MYQAAAAARRSADLSRQVGAALSTKDGALVAIGCNDTPKSGGGLYWAGDEPDGRDFELFGHDPSEQARREIISEILERFHRAKILAKTPPKKDFGAFADKLLAGDLRDAQITKLLEFGRVLHSEMAAITDAARRGIPTIGTTLYCTTFPCHLCARLIIASGIDRVVFIEPYPKSKTYDLYYDSVVVDRLDWVTGKVNFQSFVGVAPRRYDQLFRMDSKRKGSKGEALHWDSSESSPRIRRFQASYIFMETRIAGGIPNWLQPAGLSWNK
jgi:cytidine deaminase